MPRYAPLHPSCISSLGPPSSDPPFLSIDRADPHRWANGAGRLRITPRKRRASAQAAQRRVPDRTGCHRYAHWARPIPALVQRAFLTQPDRLRRESVGRCAQRPSQRPPPALAAMYLTYSTCDSKPLPSPSALRKWARSGVSASTISGDFATDKLVVAMLVEGFERRGKQAPGRFAAPQARTSRIGYTTPARRRPRLPCGHRGDGQALAHSPTPVARTAPDQLIHRMRSRQFIVHRAVPGSAADNSRSFHVF